MRTTVTLDDDLFHLLEQVARKADEPFKKVLNDVIRAGLGRAGKTPVRKTPYRTRTVHLELLPGIQPDRLKDLVNEWDDETFRRKAARS